MAWYLHISLLCLNWSCLKTILTWIYLSQDSAGMLSLLGTMDHCLKTGKKQSCHAASVTNICIGLLAGFKVLFILLWSSQTFSCLRCDLIIMISCFCSGFAFFTSSTTSTRNIRFSTSYFSGMNNCVGDMDGDGYCSYSSVWCWRLYYWYSVICLLYHHILFWQSVLAEGDICASQRRASSEGLGLLARLGNDMFTARMVSSRVWRSKQQFHSFIIAFVLFDVKMHTFFHPGRVQI